MGRVDVLVDIVLLAQPLRGTRVDRHVGESTLAVPEPLQWHTWRTCLSCHGQARGASDHTGHEVNLLELPGLRAGAYAGGAAARERGRELLTAHRFLPSGLSAPFSPDT